jgi:hypothetical protein
MLEQPSFQGEDLTTWRQGYPQSLVCLHYVIMTGQLTLTTYDQAIGVRSPAGEKDFFSSLCVQTGSGAHPAPCTMGTGGTFPGGKARPGRDADHSPPSSAEAVNE